MVTVDPCLRLPDERDQKAVTALAAPGAAPGLAGAVS